MDFLQNYSDYIVAFLTFSFWIVVWFCRKSFVTKAEFEKHKKEEDERYYNGYERLNETLHNIDKALGVVQNDITHIKEDITEIKAKQ